MILIGWFQTFSYSILLRHAADFCDPEICWKLKPPNLAAFWSMKIRRYSPLWMARISDLSFGHLTDPTQRSVCPAQIPSWHGVSRFCRSICAEVCSWTKQDWDDNVFAQHSSFAAVSGGITVDVPLQSACAFSTWTWRCLSKWTWHYRSAGYGLLKDVLGG